MQTALAPEFKNTPDGDAAEAILRKCVHCGFCTATCPTYQLLGDELDGPRGRIYLMKQVLEGATPTRATQLHLDRCLTCRNCESTCPSGVQYAHLLDIGRHIVEAKVERPAAERAVRWLLKTGLTSPLFGTAMALGRMARPLLPAASSTRAVALLILGIMAGCTQPASMSTRRACVRVGQTPASCTAGTLFFSACGSRPRTSCPIFMAGANSGEVRPSFKIQRTARSITGRCTLASTILRPMSSRWPYCTPLGQVLSQLRQVRQRSRCA
jgi:glycolate oxidase iron-sulfur subunit